MSHMWITLIANDQEVDGHTVDQETISLATSAPNVLGYTIGHDISGVTGGSWGLDSS